MQSAPVCGCGFVGVLVRTSSSRDLFFVCAPCALRMIRYNPISFRLRFVRISSQHHCLRSVPLPYPPLLSLSFRPSRPAVGHAGCLSDSSSSDEERQALALAAAPQLARVQLMTCSHVLLACRSGASSGTSTPRLASFRRAGRACCRLDVHSQWLGDVLSVPPSGCCRRCITRSPVASTRMLSVVQGASYDYYVLLPATAGHFVAGGRACS